MSFLSPLLFVGLGAIAVPILVHLIQRERKRVVEFPSLMFIQRIPYQSVRRRRIRHWALLLMRAAAIALIVAAFARPYLPASAAAALAATGGSREVVILLDQSASMGYGDRWQRAKDEAGKVIDSLGGADKATLVLFGRNAEENMRATSDRGRLQAALRSASLTAGGTRFGPALKLAESILSRSTLQRKEAFLISDFQKTGWTGSEDVHFPEGITLTPVSVATETVSNVSVPSVTFARSSFSSQERVTVTAGVANRGTTPVSGVPVSLEIDGHVIETLQANVGPNAATSVSFSPFTLSEPSVHGVVKAGTDPMPADNTFDFIVTPSQSVSILVVDNGGSSS
ncbi:MAG TPA: BatA domain-containing protein, partial [Gemmatimonadaceae bacterium]